MNDMQNIYCVIFFW